MKKMIHATIILIVFCFVLVGCKNKEEIVVHNSLVGKWADVTTYGTFVYTFNEDGTCSYDAVGTIMTCTYMTNEDKLSVTYDENPVAFETTYTIEGDRLNILDSLGTDTFYERVK